MKKSNLIPTLIVIISICSLISCSGKNTESELYIVDSIKLGSSMKDYEKQVSKNKDIVSRKQGRFMRKLQFVTQVFIPQSEIRIMSSEYTITFNSSDDGEYTDYGLIIPTPSSTKDNLLGITILFGRTHTAYTDKLRILTNNIGEPIPYFVQGNSDSYISRVKNLLIKKYGKPTKVKSQEHTSFYAFNGTNINIYGTEKDNKGEILEWDNDVVKITFFTGINNYNQTYNYINDTYFVGLSIEDRNKTKFLEKNHVTTKGYAYLKYELKEDYIKEKKLDEPNI